MKKRWNGRLIDVEEIDQTTTSWGDIYRLYKDRWGDYYVTETDDDTSVMKMNGVQNDMEAEKCFIEYMESVERSDNEVMHFL